MNATPSCRSLVWIARVCGLLSTIVLAMLLAVFAQRETTFPSDDQEFLSLKQELSANPDQQDLRRQIRDISAQQCDDYFIWQRWSRRGAILLAIGLVITTSVWQWIAVKCHGERRPDVSATVTMQRLLSRRAQLACIGLLLLLLFATSVWIAISPRVRLDATIRPDTANCACSRINATDFAESTVWRGPQNSSLRGENG